MAEEKEAATATSTLSRLENHVTIVLGAETLVQNLKALEVIFEGAHERPHPIVRHLDTGAYNQCIICLML